MNFFLRKSNFFPFKNIPFLTFYDRLPLFNTPHFKEFFVSLPLYIFIRSPTPHPYPTPTVLSIW